MLKAAAEKYHKPENENYWIGRILFLLNAINEANEWMEINMDTIRPRRETTAVFNDTAGTPMLKMTRPYSRTPSPEVV